MILIESRRMKIRAFNSDDLEALILMMTDAHTMKFTGFKEPQSIERIKEFLGKWEVEGKQNLGVWAAECKLTNELFGWVMLKPTISDIPELGYMIIRPQWGKGYATEIGAMMLNYASQTLSISKVMAVTSPRNHASIRVLEKIGMSKSEYHSSSDEDICYEIYL